MIGNPFTHLCPPVQMGSKLFDCSCYPFGILCNLFSRLKNPFEWVSEPFATCSEAMHFNGKPLVFIFFALEGHINFCNFESYLHINQI